MISNRSLILSGTIITMLAGLFSCRNTAPPASPDSKIKQTSPEEVDGEQQAEVVSDQTIFSANRIKAIAQDLDVQDPDRIAAMVLKIGPVFKSTFDARNPPGTSIFKRAVFLKTHGCSRAKFTIRPNIPEELKIGLFAEAPNAEFEAWVRISSDTVPATSDFDKSTVGFAIKVLGVEGEKVLPGELDENTQDFLTQNHPVFFADTAEEFYGLFFQTLSPARIAELRKILDEDMKKEVTHVAQSEYHSTTPYRLGSSSYVKYRISPCEGSFYPKEYVNPEPVPTEQAANPNYLRERWHRDLKKHGFCWNFEVQVATPSMPIDRATILWSPEQSPFVNVAQITVPQVSDDEAIDSMEAACEHFSFTPWHALKEHKPAGSINEVRGIIYKRMADHRRAFKNNQPIQEPEE